MYLLSRTRVCTPAHFLRSCIITPEYLIPHLHTCTRSYSKRDRAVPGSIPDHGLLLRNRGLRFGSRVS